jgi:ribosomal-protein-alanine N-acetyltransferase
MAKRKATRAQAAPGPRQPCPHVRWLIRRDVPEVLAIEAASFEYAWVEADFLRCLRQRNCIGMVAEIGELIVGFMVYALYKDHLEVLNFAVHPEHRRRGIGIAMVEKLRSKLSSHRRHAIHLVVREANLAAQLFFKSQGFKATLTKRLYFKDSGEDGYLLVLDHRGDVPPGHNRLEGLDW